MASGGFSSILPAYRLFYPSSILRQSWCRPLGLRGTRIYEWLRSLRSVDRRVSIREWLLMAWLTATADLRRPAPVVANYSKCIRCPYHDREFRQCLLCGCYMPYKIAAGGRCAAREIDPASPIGF
jgi:hypothetical protein